MMKKLSAGVFATVAAISLAALSAAPASADGWYGRHAQDFRFIFPLAGIPWYPQEDMVKNCGGTYDHAAAKIWVRQRDGKTHVKIHVSNSVPNTLWTIWLRLDKPSELTGLPITALANPSDTSALAAITPDANLTQTAKDLGLSGDDGRGGRHAANAFWTDKWGNGAFYAKLDYPLVKGAVQFQDFDATLARAAIANAPFRLRLASHCDDNAAHGLVPAFHEMWFDW